MLNILLLSVIIYCYRNNFSIINLTKTKPIHNYITLNFIISWTIRIISSSKPVVQFWSIYGSFSLVQNVKVQDGTFSGTLGERTVIFVSSPCFKIPLSHWSIRIGFNVSVKWNHHFRYSPPTNNKIPYDNLFHPCTGWLYKHCTFLCRKRKGLQLLPH